MVPRDAAPDRQASRTAGASLRLAAWAVALPALTLFLAPGSVGIPRSLRLGVSQVAFLTPYVLAVVATALAARRSVDAERRFWSLLALACGLLLANETLVSVVLLQRGRLVPMPLNPLLTAGAAIAFITLLVTMTRLRIPQGVTRFRYAVDALLVGALTFIISLSALVEPLFAPYPDIPRLERILAAFYPVIAVVVFGGTLTNLVGLNARRWASWERLVAAGVGVFAIALAAWPLWYLSAMRIGGPIAPAVEAMWSLGHHLLFVAAAYRLTSPGDRWDVPVLRGVPTLSGSWPVTLLLGLTGVVAVLFVYRAHVADSGTLTSGEAELLAAALGALLVVRTGLVAAENRVLRRAATLDPVTGLPNHRSFHELLAAEVELAVRFGDQVSVAIMDIDSFCSVNDLMGHPEGDKMLMTVGDLLGTAVPERSSVCRSGGDEFALVMPGVGPRRAWEVCDRIRIELGNILCPALPKVKASFGIASFPAHAVVKDELVRLAEGAQYWAKLHGKDQVVLYDPEVVEVLGPEDRIGLMQREHVLDTMTALAAAVDARDPGTRFHSRTVAALAVRLAEDLGMDADRIRLLEMAAILHDVGKIGVSDSVLNKPGPLTESERRHVQEHPLLADRILSATSLAQVVPWVVAHHERWDGKGYPYGLPGEMIPLEARILAICDAYDAMISDRPYRSALSLEAALQEIDLNIGTQFDPDIAERFIRIAQSDGRETRRAAGA